MLEKRIESYLAEQVKALGGLCWKFTSESTVGIPDRIILYQGICAFVETKAPGQKPRPIQLVRHKEIQEQNFSVYVIDSKEGVNEFIEWLQNRKETHEWTYSSGMAVWTPRDTLALKEFVEEEWQRPVDLETVKFALDWLMDVKAFDPLEDFFKTLPEWDGKVRLETCLIDYLGAEDTAMTRAISKNYFTACVGRALSPGSYWSKALLFHGNNNNAQDFMDILIDEEEWICQDFAYKGPRKTEQHSYYWFVDAAPFLDQKFSKNTIEEKYIEFELFLRRNEDFVGKGVHRHERWRPCVFYAKSENPKFLHDNVRDFAWAIVPIDPNFKIDVQKLSEEREQIWAEALHYWK